MTFQLKRVYIHQKSNVCILCNVQNEKKQDQKHLLQDREPKQKKHFQIKKAFSID